MDEQYSVLRSFIKDGLDRGDRAFHLVDPERRPEHLRRLAEAEIDVRAAIDAGQLQVQVWEQGQIEGRRFDPDSWLEAFRQALESGPSAGYAHTRFLGHMGWAHAEAADGEDWFDLKDESTLPWKKVAATLDAAQQRLSQAVSEVASGARTSPLGEAERFDLILGITGHAAYHAGQIQLIKKLI